MSQRGVIDWKVRVSEREKKLASYQGVIISADQTFQLVLYTDGSASIIGRVGGWAVVAVMDDKIAVELAGHQNPSSTNRAELMAIIMALRLAIRMMAKTPSLTKALIRSDSQYCVNGCNDWLWNWESSDWKGHNKKPPENQDLWALISELITRNPKRFAVEWVRGHSGNVYNDRADALAGEARLACLQNTAGVTA